MPATKRIKTKYPGVYYIIGSTPTGDDERVYYVRYRKNGKMIEEKAGSQYVDDMTAARANQIRSNRIQNRELSNQERREAEKAKEKADQSRWTIDRIWDEYRKGRRKNRNLDIDAGRYAKHLKPIFGDKTPSEIAPLDVDRLSIGLMKKLSPQSVKHILSLLTRIANYGVNTALCSGLSFQVKKPAVYNIKTEDLTDDQLRDLIEAIDKADHIAAANMMRLALFTGMRRGEMFKLKWADVDFNRGFISLVDTKGGPDQRIPLNDAARDLLDNHPRTGSSYVFPGRSGKQRTDIKHQVNQIKKAAGLPKDFRALHGLRHVYASMLASSGQVDMYTLQKLLTHKSPIMTQRYAHLRDDALRRASDLAGSIIEGATHNTDEEGAADHEK